MLLEILMQASKQASKRKQISCLKLGSKEANKLETFTKNSENRLKSTCQRRILANELRTNKMDYQLKQGWSLWKDLTDNLPEEIILDSLNM